MKTKRFLLTLLVALASVTVAWADKELNYDIVSFTGTLDGGHGDLKQGYLYIRESEATAILDVHEPHVLQSYFLRFLYQDEESDYPTWISIEGSNDDSHAENQWQMLYSGPVNPSKTDMPQTSECKYYRFKFVNEEGKKLNLGALSLYKPDLKGNGTAADPFLIEWATDMYQMQHLLAYNGNRYFKLTNDIDMSGKTWTAIDNSLFCGGIDGDNHVIKNLTAEGIFNRIGSATIKNLGFENCHFIQTVEHFGCLAQESNNTTFRNCYVVAELSIVPDVAVSQALVCNPTGNTIIDRCYIATNINDEHGVHAIVCPKDHAASVTVTNCCYYSTSALSSAGFFVTKDELASGHTAYLLCGGHPLPYCQTLGTDAYPHLKCTGNNYVYLDLDNTTYTNACPHRDCTFYPMVIPSCLGTDGRAEYGICHNEVCGKYFFASNRKGATSDINDLKLNAKATKILDHEFNEAGKLIYSESKKKNDTYYHNVMELSIGASGNLVGDYIFAYTVMDDDDTFNLHLFYESSMREEEDRHISIKFYVNNAERTDLGHKILPTSGEKHEVVTFDELHRYDQIKVLVNFHTHGPNGPGSFGLFAGTEKPILTSHVLEKHDFNYNCIDGGYSEHYQCNQCAYAFPENTPESDDFKTTDYFYLAPVGSHNFGLWNHQEKDNLWSSRCQNELCTTIDPEHQYILKDYHNGTDLELAYDDDTYTAVEPLTLVDGKAYNSPVPFHAGEVSYARSLYPFVWNSWFMPFSVSTETLAECGITTVGCVESIINYDTNYDGKIDKTVLEVILKKNGTLNAGVPYLVKTGLFYDYPLQIGESEMIATDDTHALHTETVSASYSIEGTLNGEMADMAVPCNSYALTTEGVMEYTTENGLPMRWYVRETAKDSPYAEDVTHGEDRQLVIRVIGEDDDPTGIRTLYSHPSEEVLDGIYDLQGRRQNNLKHGINIIGGKKYSIK